MTYLVTGAAGFIGSQVANQLLSQGHDVVGVDNLNDYYDPKLKKHRLEVVVKNGLQFEKLDIEDLSGLQRIFKNYQFDVIFNLAARAGVRYSMENPFVYMTTNAMGTLNILECMRNSDSKKMVLASTSSLYAGQPMPFVETLPVNTPISPYAASKKAAEVMSYSYHHLYGIDVSVVRYFTVYGPAGRPDMSIFRFIKWIDDGFEIELFGDGTQTRDFTFVDDIASGTILAGKKVGYEIFNLGGGGTPISLLEVIKSIETLLGKKAKIRHLDFHKADLTETSANIEKAKKLLSWNPKVDFQEGLDRSVKWYLENKNLGFELTK
ncbi:MAG: SDR family NAD(P)-dependent oxidoreductase [Bdellovibrionales bacterium]|nr:SDR family NAD(P)-dependent oxidoreductase [Bdellovibrionales bacterium]